ncbi:MAG: hypothetical protein WEC84_01620 [Candidatus Andersenbacteria bacterium]
MADKKPNWWHSHRNQAMRMGVSFLSALGGNKVRWLCILLGIVVVAWLIVARVVGVLQAETSLPPGVTPNNPTLERGLLETIESNRSGRSQYSPPSYESFDRFFVAPVASDV